MANALFNNYRNMLIGAGSPAGLVDWDADTIKVYLMDAADSPAPAVSLATANDLAAAGKVATATLGSVTTGSVSTGTADAADTTFTAVSGDQSENLVIWKDTGTQSTSPNLLLLDTFASGMPVTPNGGNIVVQWNASGIVTFGAGS